MFGFEVKLKKIRENAAGQAVSFISAGLNNQDCARLCEAFKAMKSNEQDTALLAPLVVGMSCACWSALDIANT